MDKDGRLCIKCGHLGHISKDCSDAVLPAWAQSYLKEIVFEIPAQVNFASASFGEFDGNVHAYCSRPHSTLSQLTLQISSVSSPVMNGALPCLSSHSVHYGVAGLSLQQQSLESQAVDANYGESSGVNKRPRVEEEAESSQQASQHRQEKQPEKRDQAPQKPTPTASQFIPQQFIPQQHPPGATQAPQAQEERQKRKGKKRAGKNVEPQPSVGMFNDLAGKYDSSVSIRHILQNNKVDLS